MFHLMFVEPFQRVRYRPFTSPGEGHPLRPLSGRQPVGCFYQPLADGGQFVQDGIQRDVSFAGSLLVVPG